MGSGLVHHLNHGFEGREKEGVLVVGKNVGERVELGFGITDQFLPGHFVNGDSFDFGKGNGPVLLVRGKAQFTVELEVLTYGPAAGEKIDGSFQPDLAGRAVEAIWPVVCLLVFRQVEELSVSRMSGWSGGETKRFREPQGFEAFGSAPFCS